MLRPQISLLFQQQPTATFPARSGKFEMKFVNDLEIKSSWKDLTDTAKIKFPKNIYVTDPFTGEKIPLGNNTNQRGLGIGKYIIAGTEFPPILLRGDRITITAGYIFYDLQNNEKKVTNIIFDGYVTKIKIKIPIEIECEDAMWKLKQIQAPNKVFPASKYTIEQIVSELLQPTGFKLAKDPSDTNVTADVSFHTQNETIAQVLLRLRENYLMESYFRDGELRCSPIVYYPTDAQKPYPVFEFQKNIIGDELNYERLDDIKIGVKAYSINDVQTSSMNKSGKLKTKKKRIEVFITYQNGKIISSAVIGGIMTNKEFTNGFDGEIRTAYYRGVTSTDQLIKLATKQMPRFYYEGYRGTFTTFGLPMVRHGYQVVIKDNVLPERNGTYFVKSVTTNSGTGGLRQHIELDMRIDGVLTPDQIAAGL